MVRMIGVFGGSGLYALLENPKTKEVETPYGKPSSKIHIGKVGNIDIAFIARHGEKHELPPHKIPFKANIYAMKQLGVDRIISPGAVGSLKAEIKPGDFLIPDQFVSFTHRDDSFYNGPKTVHISSADPYCPELRKLIINECKSKGYRVHDKGTVVVIQGPRFASRAESDFYRRQGWDVINMTMYPELILARELEICYVNIAIITDYDTGLKEDPNIEPVNIQDAIRIFKKNTEKIKKLIFDVAPKISKERSCLCAKALEGAEI